MGGTADLLSRHHFTIRKKFGQNFLVDPSKVEGIVDSAELTKEDAVLEIGPGLGGMTQLLSERAGSVTAVEIDKELIPILKESLKDCGNVDIVNADILKFDPKAYAEEKGIKSFKVVANLPYYITTPILMHLLEGDAPLKSITVMVQKEVAERMRSGPGTKDYGALSLAVQYRAKPTTVCTVPPECFIPRPNVDSAVVRLDLYETPPVSAADPARMKRIIRAAFNQRRKTLANALSADPALGVSREAVQQALISMGLDERVRGETLTLERFAELSDRLDSPSSL